MRKYFVLTCKVLAGLVVLVMILLIAASIMLNTRFGQQKLLSYSVSLLHDKLQTKVQIDSVSVNFLTFDVHLMGIYLEDRQQRKLLQADHLAVALDLKELLSRKVEVTKADIAGVKTYLYHPQDSAANYQFVIDAFKSNETNKKNKENRYNLAFDICGMNMTDIYIENHSVTKNGLPLTTTLTLGELKHSQKGHKQIVIVDGLHFTTNNHQRRKNAGHPGKGAFDAGHIDVIANLQLTVNHFGKDTANISLSKCVATDERAGLNVKDLHFDASINKTTAFLSNVALQHQNTSIRFDNATVTLPNKKEGRKIAYKTSLITGHTILKDIAKPFAPVLRQFSIPIDFKVILSGTDSSMQFNNIHVNTTDQKLKIDAVGNIAHLQEREKLFLQFHVNKMITNAQTAKKIIDQFIVKKFLMRQLNNLGTISYVGAVEILYKKELFRGVLGTSKGSMNLNLTLNENTKYLSGQVQTTKLQVGRVIEMQDIGDVGFKANFNFDYSKPRTANIRRLKGGNLPIGQVSITGISASYKNLRFNNVDATITSDGAVANGHLTQKKKLVDLLCDFTFNNTDSIPKMKIKPGIKVHDVPKVLSTTILQKLHLKSKRKNKGKSTEGQDH